MSAKANILIVDDEPEIGSLLKMLLEDEFEVVTFTDPRVACEEITKKAYDLIISDIKMPFLTGLDVVRHVKTVRAETPIVLISGHAQTERDKEEARMLGAEGVLFKPFGDLNKLIDYLGDLIKRGSTNRGSGGAAVPAAPAAASPAVVAPAAPAAAKPLIMVIDDESDLMEVLSILLSDFYDIVMYGDPTEALKHLNDQKFQMILTDLNMPNLSGVEVIQRIRTTHKDIPIIIMSGHGAGEQSVSDALKAGGNDVLPKPFPDPESLLAQLNKWIKS